MNKKGETGIVGVIILFIIFIVVWFIWLAGMVNSLGQTAITMGSLTGVEAFVMGNLNMFIMIAMLLGIMGFMYFRGAQ